jgi:hypothetical protein
MKVDAVVAMDLLGYANGARREKLQTMIKKSSRATTRTGSNR